jgi:hypothetical protein
MHHPECSFPFDYLDMYIWALSSRWSRPLGLLADPEPFSHILPLASFICFSTETSIILKVLWTQQSILSSPMLGDCRSQLTDADY